MCGQQREMTALVRLAESQGFRVKTTRKGWVVYAKRRDGGTVWLHKTPSDWRAAKNIRAELRKIGVEI